MIYFLWFHFSLTCMFLISWKLHWIHLFLFFKKANINLILLFGRFKSSVLPRSRTGTRLRFMMVVTWLHPDWEVFQVRWHLCPCIRESEPATLTNCKKTFNADVSLQDSSTCIVISVEVEVLELEHHKTDVKEKAVPSVSRRVMWRLVGSMSWEERMGSSLLKLIVWGLEWIFYWLLFLFSCCTRLLGVFGTVRDWARRRWCRGRDGRLGRYVRTENISNCMEYAVDQVSQWPRRELEIWK